MIRQKKSQALVIVIIVVVIVIIIAGVYFFSMSGTTTGNVVNSGSGITTIPSSNSSGTTSTTGTTTSSSGNTYGINIMNYAFVPSTLNINAGDTVVWINKDSVSHTIVSDSGSELSSVSIGNGKSYTHTFNNEGTFNYHCSIHPNMKGMVVVGSVDSSSSSSSSSTGSSGGY
jgi:plastocyanin